MRVEERPSEYRGADRVPGVDLHLDRRSGRVRSGLMDAFREAIRSGRLAPGTQLPSSRVLAGDIGVARNTVARAYAELIVEGWLIARPGSGTEVSPRAAELVAPRVEWRRRPAPRPPVHDLRPGHPDLSSFPRQDWIRALKRALAAAPNEAFGYADPYGRPELRQALATYLARARGVRARPDNIIVCCGAAEGLNLLAGTFVERGITGVAIEAYGLPAHRESLTRAGLRTPPLAVDAHGADVSALEGMPDVGAVLMTPSHQFPLGAALHPDRRSAVVDWARRTGSVIIEDDYDGEFRYDRTPVGALHGLDRDHVVYLGTASKSLAPGLRLGWLVVPDHLVDAVARQKGGTEATSGFVDQLAMAEFIESGAYDRHIRTMRTAYRRRREQLVEAVARTSPRSRISGMSAGLHVLAELPEGDESALSRTSAWQQLGVRGLSQFRHPEVPMDRDGVVIGYAAAAPSAWSGALEALTRLLP